MPVRISGAYMQIFSNNFMQKFPRVSSMLLHSFILQQMNHNVYFLSDQNVENYSSGMWGVCLLPSREFFPGCVSKCYIDTYPSKRHFLCTKENEEIKNYSMLVIWRYHSTCDQKWNLTFSAWVCGMHMCSWIQTCVSI